MQFIKVNLLSGEEEIIINRDKIRSLIPHFNNMPIGYDDTCIGTKIEFNNQESYTVTNSLENITDQFSAKDMYLHTESLLKIGSKKK